MSLQLLTDADQLRETYRAKRAAYHEQYHPFKRDREYDKVHRIESKLDFDRGGESITTSAARSNNGLSRSVKSNPRADIEYRYIETPTAISLNPVAAGPNRPSNQQHFNRSEEHPSPSPGPSEAGDRREPKRANRDRNSVAIKLSKSQTHDIGEYSFWGLMILISFYTIYQSSTNLKTIQAQRQIIQQNSEAITAQINYLNTLRR